MTLGSGIAHSYTSCRWRFSLVALILLIGPSAIEAATSAALLSEGTRADDVVALAEARLSQSGELVLVECAAVDKVLREQKLALAGLTADKAIGAGACSGQRYWRLSNPLTRPRDRAGWSFLIPARGCASRT